MNKFKSLFEGKESIEQTLTRLLDTQKSVTVQIKDNTFGKVESISAGVAYLEDMNMVGYKQYKYLEVDIDDIKSIVNSK